MDLDRIRQNFRLRSGRWKQAKKPNPHAVVANHPPTPQNEPNQPNGAPVGPRKKAGKKENPKSSRPPPPKDTSQKPEHPASPSPPKDTFQEPKDPASPQVADSPKQEQEKSLPRKEEVEHRSPSPEHTPSGAPPGQIQGEEVTSDQPPAEPEHTQSGGPPEQTQGEQVASEQPPAEPEQPPQATMAEPHLSPAEQSSDGEDFDLNPPKSKSRPPSLEALSELLFSSGHLDSLLHYPPQLAKLSAFLQKYLPNHQQFLSQYLETQKAIRAVEYANAVAAGLKPAVVDPNATAEPVQSAAKLDSGFEKISQASFEALVGHALPSYISYVLIKKVSECLTTEITGRSTPAMKELVGGLSEVFCLTDPNQEDNPIIYASEEFYRLTRYGPEDVLNNNCRFLQGKKTDPKAHTRLKTAIQKGDGHSETLLNYRRDGRPFINLLMIAPLHDKSGKLKYHIGAQVDVTGLVQSGRTLDGFQRYLLRRTENERRQTRQAARDSGQDDQRRKNRALAKLRDLSEMFDLEESAVVQAHSRSNSLERDDDDTRSIGSLERTPRRVYGDEDMSEDEDEDEVAEDGKPTLDLELGTSGSGKLSGKLPGVYDSFMLFRPAPSLRIVFVSPKLRKLGKVLQTPFLSHVAAPSGTLNGLSESLKTGVPVSAKIHFTPERGPKRTGTQLKNGAKHEDGSNGKAIWVSCTPLLGEDDHIGVWVCIIVEKSKMGSARTTLNTKLSKGADEPIDSVETEPRGREINTHREGTETVAINGTPSSDRKQLDDTPIKPIRIDSRTVLKELDNDELKTNGDTSSKALRAQESLYFDTEQGQQLPHEEVGMPERTEDTQQQKDQIQPEAEEQPQSQETSIDPQAEEQPQSQQASVDHQHAVATPVEEYRDPMRTQKPYSVEIPGFGRADTSDGSEDDYVATRSPQLHSAGAKEGERVLIEEDSDVSADERSDLDEPVKHYTHKASSPTADIPSPDSEIPPSIPSSAQMSSGSDNGSRNLDSGGELDTPTKTRHIDPVSARYDSSPDHQGSDISSRGRGRAPRKTLDQDLNTTAQSQHRSDSRHESEPRHESNPQPYQQQDENTPPSIDSPIHKKHSPHSRPTSSRNLQPDHSPEPNPDPSSHIDDEDTDQHDQDVANWVTDSRPASSRDPNHPGKGMDYLMAGSSTWNSRHPRLSKEVLDEMNKDTKGEARSDGALTNDQWCLRSPYSVD